MEMETLYTLLDNENVQWVLRIGGLALAALAGYAAARFYLLRFVRFAAARSRSHWDDMLVKNQVFSQLSHLVPPVILLYGIQFFPPALEGILRQVLGFVIVLVVIRLIDKLLSALLDIYNSYPVSRKKPIKGYIQLVKIFDYLIGGVAAVCILLGVSPWGILSGLGALTAVLLLIFKDTILSFVASIQIVGNDLVRVGDWIEMPSTGADGDVIDVALHTVKVQNFDKTVVTIPTYKLIETGFRNWRGMQESGGRRIKRAIPLDMNSIRFLTDEEIGRLEKVQLLQPYIQERLDEVKRANEASGADPSSPLNGRRLTNVGTYRAYVEAYLKNHPMVHHEGFTFLVRQLAPTPEGLPLEVYVFTTDNRWVAYEKIQSDIFDHLLVAVGQFGLRLFQNPSEFYDHSETLPVAGSWNG